MEHENGTKGGMWMSDMSYSLNSLKGILKRII